jgi:glycosyltransferase 2 family protein
MKDAAPTVLRRLIPGVVLGFVVLVGLALLGDLREVGRQISVFRWEYFLAAMGFTLLNYALRFVKWHFYLGQIGVRRLSIGKSMGLFVGGFPLAVTPGKLGEVIKAIWLMRVTGVPVARGVSVVVAERISDGLAVLVLSALGVVSYPRYWPVFITILAILLIVVIISQIRPLALWLLDQGEKINFFQRMVHSLREFYEGSFMVFRPAATAFAVLLGTISWLGEGLGFYLILLGLGMQPSLELAATAVFVLAFSTVVGAASALPGGLGAAEASIAGMLLFILQLNPAVATSATLLIRLATLWFGVVLGLVVWTISPSLFGLDGGREVVLES